MVEEKNKKGLGRGLMSLFGDQADENGTDQVPNTAYLSVSISDLEKNQFQPRNYFDDKKIDELAQSIKKNGLIQPIAVRKGKKNGYEIIAGERRWIAAQKAGLHEVPVIVLNLDDDQSLELAIIENIQREELNSIEEAKGYDRLIKQFNYNHEKLSEFMGKSRSHIVNTLRLLNLPKEVIKLVDEGKLTAGQVRPLVGRHNANSLAQQILKEKLSSRSIENLVKNDKEKEKNKSLPRKSTDPNILLAQRRIEENLGLKTKIVYRKNSSGKVVIEYKNIDQFDMLSQMLVKKV
ncbi:ParB/RepB/Spo0J family partition protein [Pelagibacteraceae bacterium]|nr:ParB/RepB/Spo0J family partition protein [Pelagibacteraceae bacterium]|tara:strand:- start:69 stop:944 length:876 start_codon:yes stop_codon:yes gene_type:complete